jgi:GT2 family glycosyltransferase
MGVDVVVINYHTDDLLHSFIDSFATHCWSGECKLTVVDVGVDQDSETLTPDPWGMNWISTRENVGYGQACNTGAAVGTNDVILLANADTLLSDGFKECYDTLMAHDDWGVLGPRQVNEMNQITAGGIFGSDRAPQQRGWNQLDNGQFSDVRDDAITISGSLYFIKRSLWVELTKCPLYKEAAPEAMGAFLPTKHYFEETFCSYHARSHGYKCVYYGPVQMMHYWHKSSDYGGWADRQFNESQATHRNACQIHGIICE